MAADSWPVSCIICCVILDTPPDNVAAIITTADHLTYPGKASGKSAMRIEAFSPDDQPHPLDDVATGVGTSR
jgi:hypothetical protein